jgi:hypothetical protein
MEELNMNTQDNNRGQAVAERSTSGNTGNSKQNFAGLSKEEIRAKIQELESQWPVERILEVTAAAFVLLNVFLNKNMRSKVQEMGDSLAELLGVEHISEWTPPKGLLDKLGITSQADLEDQIKKLKSQL